MRFSIVVPALNEEGAVVSTLQRCLRAAGKIKEAGLGITDVEVILVNDGSTDRTEELARKIDGVKVIGYAKNRGYGAAIMTGFESAQGDLLSFLDCDGTCDPDFFVELIRLLNERSLDVTLGGRMHPGSKMPAVRVVGNWLFRTLVNVIGGSNVTDVASGMRVIRKEAFRRLLPLPAGLNFTPAMSVRALLDPKIKIGEIPMPYEERVGRSKTNVVLDGFRFLGIILETAITYRPMFFFAWAAALLAVLSFCALAFELGGPSAPLMFYLENRFVQSWMVFRIVLVSFFLALAAFLLALGVVAQSLVGIINKDDKRWEGWVEALINGRFGLFGFLSLLFAVFLNRRPLHSYFTTGHIPSDYWVFPIVGSIFALVGCQFIAFGLVGRIARLLRERERLR